MWVQLRASLLAVLALVPMVAACGARSPLDAPSGHEDAATVCAMHCDALAAAGCPPAGPGCAAACAIEVGYEGKCASTSLAVLECLANVSADQLCTSQGCDEEQAERRACDRPPGGCSGNQCVGFPDHAHCTMTCSGNVYETICAGSPGSYSCTCILNGSAVGTCTDVTTWSAACCNGIFASQ